MMKVELTLDGKLIDPDSWRLKERLSATALKKLGSDTCSAIEHEKRMKEQSLNDAIRDLKLTHGL